MLLNPHVGAETFYLLPETVQVLLLWMRMVGFKNTECVVVNLFPALDVSFQASQHPVKLTLLLLIQFTPYPG